VLEALAFLVIWVGLTVMWIAAIVSAARFSNAAFVAAGRLRPPTIFLVVITGWVGAGYYWIVIKREVAPYRNATMPPTPVPARPPG
jgi:hypothetical protein